MNIIINYAVQLWRSLLQNKFASGVIKIASGTALGQAIVVVFSPVITRLYSPCDFGAFAIYGSLLAAVTVIGCLCYELAIPLPREDQVAVNILALALFSVLGVSAIITLAVWAERDSIANLTNTPAIAPYLWLLPVGVLGACSYNAFNYWAIRNSDYTTIGRTKVIQGIMLTLTQIGLGVLNVKPLGLLLGLVLGHTAGLGSLVSSALKNGRNRFHDISAPRIAEVAARYRHFPIISTWSSLLDSIGAQAPAFLLAVFYGPSVAGWFALSQRVIDAPCTLIARGVGQVFLGEVSLLRTNNPEEMLTMYLSTSRKLFILALVIFLPFCILAPSLFRIIFGQEWQEAGLYTRAMVPMIIAKFTVSPLSQAINVLERQGVQFFWVMLWLVASTGSLKYSYSYDFSPVHAIEIFSVTLASIYLIHFCLCVYLLKSEAAKNKAVV